MRQSKVAEAVALRVARFEQGCSEASHEIAVSDSHFLIEPIPSQRDDGAGETEGDPFPHQSPPEEILVYRRFLYLNLSFS